MTPGIKLLLRKRCQLRSAGRITEADAINLRINDLIQSANKSIFSNLENASVKDLWYAINTNSGHKSLHLTDKL